MLINPNSHWTHKAIKNHPVCMNWRRKWHPTPVFFPGESHGRRRHRVAQSWTWLKQLSLHACILPQEALKSNRLSTLTLCFIFKTHSYYSRLSLRKWKWRSLSPVRLIATPWTVHELLQARILECVAFPFSRGSSQPRDQTQVSHIAGRFFTNWAIREALQS